MVIHGPLLMLLLALTLGLLIGLPQILPSLRYYPLSIRQGKTYQEKAALGKVGFKGLWQGLGTLKTDPCSGVFGPEVISSGGLLGPFLALLSRSWHQWVALVLFITLARGGVLFKLLSPLMLRIPARWCYFIGLTLVFMSTDGLSTLSLYVPNLIPVLVLLQCVDLVMRHSPLWPMIPFVQRWERPSRAFRETDQVRAWKLCTRVGGMPYPLTTGQIHHIRSLGYNGGSQLKVMALLRGEDNPNGSGDHQGTKMTPEDYSWWVLQDSWEALERRYPQ